uniref:Serine aminopeptidase S33 domain-containing protein n=1 Tax=Astatotilapia calliptera TaxID=8154 RepID=A0AAX7T1U4_ASTCA
YLRCFKYQSKHLRFIRSLVRFPFFVDLSRPEDVLNHTCNFYLNTEEGISVGVWHTLPASQWEKSARRSPEWYRETLGDGTPVIIYLHGNIGTRWDKSSFGDSTGDPSEAGLTNDALYLYHWVKKHSKGSLVCLWGHSLGSGVATNAAVKIQDVFERILQHIFHLFFQMYRFLPGFESLLWNIMKMTNIVFANDKNLKSLISPLLILHSEDDNVVPYHMGLEVQKLNTDAHVEMISYSASLGFSHSSIYLDPNLSAMFLITIFVHSTGFF